jgi:hypothetical protein
MHAPPDKSRNSSYRTEASIGAKLLILPAIVAVVLAALAIADPKSTTWIAQAVDAEYGGISFAADAPTETAQPGMTIPMRTVDAY